MDIRLPSVLSFYKDQQYRTHEKSDDYRQRLEEISINKVFKQESEYGCRKDTDDQRDAEIKPLLLSPEEGLRHGEELVPVKDDNGQDRTQLYDHIEHSCELVLRETDDVSRKNHVTGGRYRDKLCYTFYYGDDDGLKNKIKIQNKLPPKYLT